jgi:hypothetical protein
MQTLSDLYKDISDLDKKNSVLKNYFMLPGFNIVETNTSSNANSSNANSSNANSSNANTISTKDNPVIGEKLFMQFLSFFNATNNNQTQKSKHKLLKKSEKTFTRKQNQKVKSKKENKKTLL